jgi:hypothetical protein
LPRVDIWELIEVQERPSVLFSRNDGEIWHVARSGGNPPAEGWNLVRQGEAFRVPLFRYAVSGTDEEALFFALSDMIQSLLLSPDLPRPILRLALPTGGLQPQSEQPAAWWFWMGCAVCVAHN